MTSAPGPLANQMSIVMEAGDACLYDVVKSRYQSQRDFKEIEVKVVTWQIMQGLQHIHSKGLIHRDLKTQNILLDMDQECIKICDFGSACPRGKNDPSDCYVTAPYRSPEHLMNRGNAVFDRDVDMWSLGCIVVELLKRSLAFPSFKGRHIDRNWTEKDTISYERRYLIEDIMSLLGPPPPSTPPSDRVRHQVQRDRRSFREVMRIPIQYSDSCLDFVSRLLCFTQNRCTLRQAQEHHWFNDVRKMSQQDMSRVFRGCFGPRQIKENIKEADKMEESLRQKVDEYEMYIMSAVRDVCFERSRSRESQVIQDPREILRMALAEESTRLVEERGYSALVRRKLFESVGIREVDEDERSKKRIKTA